MFMGLVLGVTTVFSSIGPAVVTVSAAAAESGVTDSDCTDKSTKEPESDKVVPDANQYKYQKDELAAFCHFGPNTFNEIEWGEHYGDKKPSEIFTLKDNFDADTLVRTLKNAGFKKLIITAKHHDGFCLYPSEYTDFNCEELGPKRDITGELTDAVRSEGLKMGLYYSGLIDWQFANDPIFKEEDNFGNACPTFEYADYSYNQMKELVDKYHPSVFWNDIGWPKQSEHMMPYFLAHYYNVVEEGVVNDRFNGLYHDFSTKEYKQGEANRKEKWEMCRGMGLSFGYNENEGDDQLISVPDLIHLLVATVSDTETCFSISVRNQTELFRLSRKNVFLRLENGWRLTEKVFMIPVVPNIFRKQQEMVYSCSLQQKKKIFMYL